MDTIGQRVRYLRKKHNITQEVLARETGISRSNISKIETDDIKPTSNAIISISKFFNVTNDWLLIGKETPSPVSYGSAAQKDEVGTLSAQEPTKSYESPRAAEERCAYELVTKLDNASLNRVVHFMKFELYLKENGRE